MSCGDFFLKRLAEAFGVDRSRFGDTARTHFCVELFGRHFAVAVLTLAFKGKGQRAIVNAEAFQHVLGQITCGIGIEDKIVHFENSLRRSAAA